MKNLCWFVSPMIDHATLLREALSLRSFEATGWVDYALIPYWLLRWVLAWLWMLVWGSWRVTKGNEWGFMWGRHDSPEPVICRRCLWAGPQRWLVHDYCDDGDGDVEPCDECPRCGGEV